MTAKKRKKRRKHARNVDWEKHGDTAFSHDRKRHRKTTTAVSDAAPAPPLPEQFTPNGVVINHSKKWATVRVAGEDRLCRISERIVEELETLLAPGDDVLVEPWADQDWVVALAPRRTRLSRLAIEGSRVTEQVVAANVDVLVIVAAAVKPALKPGLIDRYLISADIGGVEPILCVNKIDLVDEAPEAVSDYAALGVPVVLTSCETGQGIEELRARLGGRLSVFAGQSGVGKSTLLNVLDPRLDLETQTVSEATEKGKHTTTSARMFRLEGDIRVIDTPGIRKLGLAQLAPNELNLYFPDIAEHSAQCKFRDCGHTHEPGCAVQAALEAEKISARRYRSYLRIRESLEEGS